MCQSHCDVCSGVDTWGACLQCTQPLSLYEGQCVAVCPNGTYSHSTSASAECQFCEPPCHSCFNPSTCLDCLQGYILHAGRCVLHCPAGYFSLNKQCVECSPSCLHCSQTSTACTACSAGLYLHLGRCVSNCPTAMFQSPSRLCQTCGPYCLKCVDAAECTVCLVGMHLLDGQCLQQCPPGYTPTTLLTPATLTYSHIAMACVPCTPPCHTCTPSSCLSCTFGHFLLDGTCVEQCPTGYFAESSSSTCRQCPPQCVSCISPTQCQECRFGTNATTLQCVPQCASIAGTCRPCDPLRCQSCDQSSPLPSDASLGTCLVCYSGLFLKDGVCV